MYLQRAPPPPCPPASLPPSSLPPCYKMARNTHHSEYVQCVVDDSQVGLHSLFTDKPGENQLLSLLAEVPTGADAPGGDRFYSIFRFLSCGTGTGTGTREGVASGTVVRDINLKGWLVKIKKAMM